MKKKFKIILALGCTALACAGLASCGPGSEVEKNRENGYKISVTYDGNGGTFLNRPGVTLMDMFNPSDYEVGPDGEVHIKLLEPTSKDRPASGGNISLTLAGHFFAGWYQTRELKTVDGVPVDSKGEALVQLEDGTYVYADTLDDETPTTALPAYEYSDYWDFENDTIDYSEEAYAETDGICEITLYAAWVEYYEFNYYYKMADQPESDWTQLTDTTTFNYKTVNAANSVTADRDTIWIPTWGECKMNYSHKYANGSEYTFPQVLGTTFDSAYLDEECLQKIEGALEHNGSLILDDGDNESLKIENRVQNIYILLEKGEMYRISTAQHLIDNPNPSGIYEIQADLDFTDLTWPNAFASGTFSGKMYGANGQTYTMRNVLVKHSSSSRTGGLFGTVADGAEIKDLAFENVTFEISSLALNRGEASYGLFAGSINDNATISNVSAGGTFRLGKVSLNEVTSSFNLWANGNVAGLTKKAVTLQVYGEEWLGSSGETVYNYTVDPTSVTLDGTSGAFSFSGTDASNRYKAEASIDIK